jgi:replicative DNA helicase
MKRLLRSLIDTDGGAAQELLVQNYQKVVASPITWDRPEDEKIYEFLKSYFQQRLEMPALATVTDFFGDDTEIQERLKDVAAAERYVRTNFAHLLQGLLENQNKIKAVALLKEAHEIITRGLIIQEGKEKVKKSGVREGLLHFTTKANELIIPEYNARIRGDIRRDGQAVWDDYQMAKASRDKVWGKFTGLNAIDTVCHGLKRGELHVHAGYAGHLKTTFATNWCYNLVTRYRTNVFYASFEMKYEHIRRLIYVVHSANNRWSGAAPEQHQCAMCPHESLDYRKVRDGELTPDEEIFYQLVIDDFNNNPEYCQFNVWAPDHDVDMDEMRLEAEMLHKELEIGFVVLDHGGLMEPRKTKRNKDYVVELNSILRDSKKFALHFNHGEGVPTLMLFQINRMGLDDADKNDGVYKMKALTYANEAEKSADVITTSYLDDNVGGNHRKNNQTKICNLKNRDNPLVEPFTATVQFKTRRITNLDTTRHTGANMSVEDHSEIQNLIGNV